jgi:ribonuclease E
MAEKHFHPQQATGQAFHAEAKIETDTLRSVPEFTQETPALVLNSSEGALEASVGASAVAYPESRDQAAASTPPEMAPTALGMPEVPSEELQTEPMLAESPVEQTADLKLVHSGVATKIPEDQIQPVEQSAEELPSTVGGHEAEQPRQVQVIELPDLVASGLVMVETVPEKIKLSEAEPDTDTDTDTEIAQRRRKRPSPTQIPAHDEPMVQVETQK